MRTKLIMVLALTIVCSCGSHRHLNKNRQSSQSTVENNTTNKKRKSADDIEYDGAQWVRNVSTLSQPSKGLKNRHIAVWASHGRYFNIAKDEWEWQRPYLFGTTEDLFTQTIVVPYLIPMLENAGATVFTPRERDWQTNEVIVDNDCDDNEAYYTETGTNARWTDGCCRGFGMTGNETVYGGGNPFEWGTTRKAKATKEKECEISYQPNIPEEGNYAVYVSYPTINQSVTDAEYIIYHKGMRTTFNVNQRMGGGTWVYLGNYDFDKGCSARNRVVLTNRSNDKGYVTADAVRFGGGMGNINRNGTTSGLPRCLEGARYYAQWAGAPDSVYNSKSGTDDYKDDINVRSFMTNWLAGGSCYVPEQTGKGVPFELSLAVHSDAGYNNDLKSIYGSLAICTTDFNNGLLASGKSRMSSKELANQLLSGMYTDLTKLYGTWATRDLYDRNYSETRCPKVPSAIIETLSHQNFPDMVMGQDPNVKFTIARSIYKTLLRFIAKQHDKQFVVSPLAPQGVYANFVNNGEIELCWEAQNDETEVSAKPTAYIVYTAIGNSGFDNGEIVKDNKLRMTLAPDVTYSFKITAINKGGESFPSETLAAVYHPGATKKVLVVNGFSRLSSPAIRENSEEQGFDFDEDPGISYGKTIGWSGKQTNFDKTKAGILGENGLGFCGNELEGVIISGNTFNYPVEHANAIASAKKYSIVSASRKALEERKIDINDYSCVDYILGLERFLENTPTHYKAFSDNTQQILEQYIDNGGRLLISGAYIASDMKSEREKNFLRRVLHVNSDLKTAKSELIYGMGTSFNIYGSANSHHYAATRCDVITPEEPAFCTLTYDNGHSACVAFKGSNSRTLTLGFPFECIRSKSKQATIMKGFLNFLME